MYGPPTLAWPSLPVENICDNITLCGVFHSCSRIGGPRFAVRAARTLVAFADCAGRGCDSVRGPVGGSQAQMKLTPTELAEQTSKALPYRKGVPKRGEGGSAQCFAGHERLELPPNACRPCKGWVAIMCALAAEWPRFPRSSRGPRFPDRGPDPLEGGVEANAARSFAEMGRARRGFEWSPSLRGGGS